jgi:hydrogenase maturation protein HypF
MIEQGFNAPPTSSVGRLFDAIASIALRVDHVTFEGQAAIQLENAATAAEGLPAYSYAIDTDRDDSTILIIDARPLIQAATEDTLRNVGAGVVARRFHVTLVEIIADVCGRIRKSTLIDAVVLSGGVFQNSLLTVETERRLTSDGFRVHRHRIVPPGDGGLSLGQLAVATGSATDT